MKKINYRKNLVFLILAMVLMTILFASCKKVENGFEAVSNDMTKPGVVSNVKVENINGAARITYTLPNSKNLLYVLARYAINDNRIRETKSSYYTDTIFVDGFAREKDYEVTLYAVSRANVMSDPVVVKVHPKTPNYILINSALNITPDFGGANFFGLNINRASLSMHLLVYNETTKTYDEQEPEYVSTDTIDISIRNLPPTPHKVGVFTTDRFGNVSDTVFKTVTPLFETLLDKSKFFTYHLSSDAPIGYGWEFRYFFDGNLGDPGWHTLSAPKTIGTFGMGVTAKISRFVVWQRPSDYYGYQNTRKFTLWGSNKDNPADVALPNNSTEGTVAGDWINLGNFIFPNPPSGLLPSQANAADKDFVAKGVNFEMPKSAPAVKYIRYECTQTWGGLDYVNAMEISMYGSPL
ncbi:DUF4959 domain-containing protein [Pedobacter frigiditerrae]|uniref:DUF4959 domain-containing protein n=1 Tax=Pedobacter frigiditerrae TaxID=2530452 RepID=A0A4R0N1W1_9SPHI|nr:DUF4959 domain-containing protein [Pedobacter frigiditerrae]TCC92362.1 DUF4959 domain-containing protein [Pedobacter frigiditerrae]